jgi:hypothetical protein
MNLQTTAKRSPKMKPTLAPLLNAEILALAMRESKTDEKLMKELMTELGHLCGVSRRMVYHWRSGHHRLPGEYVPTLCQRFGSNALMDELNRASAETIVPVPDGYDLALLASRSIREDLSVYEQFLQDFESDGIQPCELTKLRELEARVHRNVHQLFEIAEADCERRLAANTPATPARKGDQRATGDRDRKTDGGSLIRAIK